MSLLQKNWSWLIVCVLALFPLIEIFSLVSFNLEYPEFDFILFDDIELSEQVALKTGRDIIPGIEIAIEQTGQWAIRWLIAVLMITPFKIVFGTKSNLFVRQAMGISCGVYVFLHAFFFMYHEGFFSIFSDLPLIFSGISAIIILALTITSNRRSMKFLKRHWKTLHRLVYFAAILTIAHVVLLNKDWELYSSLFCIGLIVRFGPVRQFFQTQNLKVVLLNQFKAAGFLTKIRRLS
ncbi:ferric reductase-like transmembrane domain-containing protein [Marinifilum flexuosum]|uniref:Sulfoxide reductase heme-binding subunit YedZ n=1 Tax=Marinifilum flexuosum TaxID=1117708 RepID=A0A419XAX7_9BACT|nr:ferric reductase-like transmembrane domain-containing protein [Marinifilum flexuosum]RKE04865.1 sulfoxide reductase heme-binding subunit YedZ [Marinifilum flexuosum]